MQPDRRELVCKELVEVVTDYFEGRLSAEERERFDRHLLGCRGCRNYVEQMRATIRTVGSLDEEDVPPAGREELLGAFRRWRDGRR